MNDEREQKNKIKIFCIFFKSELHPGNEMLKKIAEIGGTNNYYISDSLGGLFKIFKTINEAIETNYGLKLRRH